MDDLIARKKAELRQHLIPARERMDQADVATNSRAIVDQLKRFEPLLDLIARRLEAPVGLYAAFRGEPDIRPLTSFLVEQGIQVAFPAIVPNSQGDGRQLRFGCYTPDKPLHAFLSPGYFGVPEPPKESLLPFGAQMAALIMPGVGFDHQGGRIGFGKGYYDQVIAAIPERPLLIGVAHPFQLLVEPLPITAHDQRLDYIVLPDRVVVVK